MNLLELIIKSDIEWPALARIAVQDDGGALKWSMSSDTPVLYKSSGVWDRMGGGSDPEYGIIEMADDWSTCIITREEWQQERDKMQKQQDNTRALADSAKEIEKIDRQINVYSAKQDNSWYERGEFPPIWCECEFRYKYQDRGISCEWESGAILFFGDELFVVKHGNNERAIDINSHEFRPIRTDRGEFPPVGSMCMAYDLSDDKWIETEIVAHRDGCAIGWCHAEMCGYIGTDKSDFRPLRTDREKAIDEMVKAITDDRIAPLYVQNIAAKLYDAGYRKEKNK